MFCHANIYFVRVCIFVTPLRRSCTTYLPEIEIEIDYIVDRHTGYGSWKHIHGASKISEKPKFLWPSQQLVNT